MFQMIVIFISFAILGGGYLIHNINDYNTLLRENAYKQSNNIIKIQNLINSNFLNYEYMKPSIILLSNKNQDKILIDKLWNAYMSYLKNNNTDKANCTNLSLTGKITKKECQQIFNKEYIITDINFNGEITNSNGNILTYIDDIYVNDVKYFLNKYYLILKNNKITKLNEINATIYNNNYFKFMILN